MSNYLLSNVSLSISFSWSMGKFIPADTAVIYAEVLPNLFSEWKVEADLSSTHYSWDSWCDSHLGPEIEPCDEEVIASIYEPMDTIDNAFNWLWERDALEAVVFATPEWLILSPKEILNYKEERAKSAARFVKYSPPCRPSVRTASLSIFSARFV